MSVRRAPSVYVIDPDERYRAELLALLERSGFRVRGCGSAEEFFEQDAAGADADCIVTELSLPGVGGMELLGLLKSREVEVPIIVLTNDPDVRHAVAAMRYKVADYLLKPVVERKLLGRIRTVLRNPAASTE